MSFSKPKIPKPPAQLPTFVGDTTSAILRNRVKKRLQGLYGRQSTMLTGGSGAPVVTAAAKSLLGS